MYCWIRENKHNAEISFGCPKCCKSNKVDGEAFGPILDVISIKETGKGKAQVRGRCPKCNKFYFMEIFVSYSWYEQVRIF